VWRSSSEYYEPGAPPSDVPADQSAILAHILSDWAEARMDHTFSNIRLNFAMGADMERISDIA
jgi:hypothetical protein